MSEKTEVERPPKPLPLFRLVVDQARITEDVSNHRYEGSGTEEDPYVVVWIPQDPGNPFNMSSNLRWGLTLIAATECFATAFASSAFSGTVIELTTDLHASTELITAGIALFVLGFALGPLLWAPLSEVYGRQIVYFISFLAFTAFNAACAGAPNVGALLVLRFFAGAFGSSPLTNGGGVIADIFPASHRGFAMSLFSLAPSFGPCFGPFIGGFTGENIGWRWVMGLLAIFSGALWMFGSLLVPETYAPVLLRRRAHKLSQMTGKVYKTRTDIEKGEISLKSTLATALVRPWILLFLEPIVLLLSLYLAIVYGTLYLLFGAFPLVFQRDRGWSEGVGGLAFLGVAVGMITATVFARLVNKWYQEATDKHGGVAPPEARLPGSMVGSFAVPIGMFWFAWTNYPSVHWIVPIMAGAPFGFGLNVIFMSVFNYLVDAYTIYAASVLAANTVLRSLFGAAFPLFTQAMYGKLGIHWASSIPAFLALACMPFPFIFYKYGAAIRARCVYASESEKVMNEIRARAAAPQESNETEGSITTGNNSTDGSDMTEKEEGPFEPIKTRASSRRSSLAPIRSRAESNADAAEYESNPYDVDRVNTTSSFAGLDLHKVRSHVSAGR